jgi:hypothetical protein
MLKLVTPSTDVYIEQTSTFTTIKGATLTLEHSLVSLSKWESKWCVPFLSTKEMTKEQTLDYIKCMTLTQNVDQSVYQTLSEENFSSIREYINATMTATKIVEKNSKPNREIITSEIIYYWMIALNIPLDPCQKWHLNRLLMLINVCSIKQQDPKKMRGKKLLRSNAALNAQRRAAMGSKG